MKKKKLLKIIVPVAILIALGAADWYLATRKDARWRAQVRDLQVQLAQSRQRVDTFTIRDSVKVWRDRVIEVDKTDYKKQLADEQLIKDLELKVRQIEAENTMLREAHGQVTLKPAGVDSAANRSIYEYHDHWVDFWLNLDSLRMEYAVRDSFKTYVDRIPKRKFLWIRWGTKGYNVHIVNFNPNAEVKYSRTIMVE